MIKKEDISYLASLFLLALFIWLRDLSWASSNADTLAVLAAIPLFIWLGSPWKLNSRSLFPLPKEAFWMALLFLLGVAANATLLLALSWTGFLWIWLSKRCEEESLGKLKKLLILPLMAFPWIALDAQALGWWFRLSGAQTTGWLFSHTGFAVFSQGTSLLIDNLPIDVEAACAGLNTLQAMLIAGAFLAYLVLGNSPRYWWNLPLLVLIAWFANTARIVTLSYAALAFSPQFAMEAFHTWGGLLVLAAMFGLSFLIFSLQEPKKSANP